MKELQQQMRDALQFYADQNHFVIDDSEAWDTLFGELPNFWSDEQGTAMVEDGSVAKAAIAAANVEILKPEPDPTHVLDEMGICYTVARARFIGIDLDSMKPLYSSPPSESEAVALLREMQQLIDHAMPVYSSKVKAILKGQP